MNTKKKNETISENIISTIIFDIYLGIKKIHDKNLIHRDLKPENLFISNDNRIKIGDFGIFKQLDLNNNMQLHQLEDIIIWLLK